MPTHPDSTQPDRWNRREFCRRSLGAAMLGLAAPQLAFGAEGPPAAPAPQRRWELFVIQHSHIDLGFTDRQEVIADYHRGFVRQAVAMALADRQKSRPPENRFKYTIEGYWSLEQFLRSAKPGERRRLVRALKSGLVELTAGYFHLTELLDQDVLASTLRPSRRFAQDEGIELVACMSCDVNGFSWGFCELLAESGVKYLSTNINTHHGGVPLGGPLKPFFWESPSGRRILVWSGLAYHRANVLGLMGYYSPDTELGFPGLDVPPRHRYEDVRDIGLAERKLLPTLAHLEKTGYPYDFLPLMGNALYTDNGPAGDQYCELLQEWNRKYGKQIHIRTATLAEFFRHLERSVPDLPTFRGEWTDWWSDGVAATPLDTMIFRNAQRTRHLVRRLDPGYRVISPARIDEIDRRLALYAEHTFGYSDTASHSLLTHQIFLRKSMHAVAADELAGQALVEVYRHRGEGEFTARRPFRYRVINPLDHPVRAAVQLPIDYWEDGVVAGGVRVVTPSGVALPAQMEPAPRGRVIVTVVELGPKGETVLQVEPAATSSPREGGTDGFSNAFYRAAWTAQRGLYSLVEATTGMELFGGEPGGAGCPVYQIFPQGNRGSAAGFGYKPRTIPRAETTVGHCVEAKRTRSGDLFERWEFRYQVAGTTSYVLAATFYRDLPFLEFAARVVKTDVMDPEGLYVAFPFAVDGGVWHLDKPGGPIRPGLDQLPGSCCDYYCIQTGAAIAGPKLGLAWTTLDAPLIHVGKIRLWDYSTAIQPIGPVYSWLTNNKWDTNFKLTCGGRFEFRYVVEVSPRFTDPAAALAACQTHTYPPVVLRY